MSDELSKEELSEKINKKNLNQLESEDGLSSLLIHNLENFAYRYLETSTDKAIKAKSEGRCYWVESIESDIVQALKWNNASLKSELISLCKNFPGQKSKELSVKLKLATNVDSEHQVTCLAIVAWQFEQKEEVIVSKEEKYSFDDLLELRNNHALVLEKVSEIF